MLNKKIIRNIAIITAGGSGKRLSGAQKKQFIKINNRPILFWTLDKFAEINEIDKIIVTLPYTEIPNFREKIIKEFSKVKVISGGKERQDSVFNALQHCPESTELILIHDGVRPFVEQKDILKMLKIAKEKKAVIPVSKVKYTIKQVENGKIIKTIRREKLFNAHTPQVFEYNLIKNCHQKASEIDYKFTDDASLLEYFGFDVHIIEISEQNIKITNQYDLKIAELILNSGEINEFE